MTDQAAQPTPPPVDPIIANMQEFMILLDKASKLMGEVTTYQAHQANVNIEQAMDWARKAFIMKLQANKAAEKAAAEKQQQASAQPPQPTPTPEAPAAA